MKKYGHVRADIPKHISKNASIQKRTSKNTNTLPHAHTEQQLRDPQAYIYRQRQAGRALFRTTRCKGTLTFRRRFLRRQRRRRRSGGQTADHVPPPLPRPPPSCSSYEVEESV